MDIQGYMMTSLGQLRESQLRQNWQLEEIIQTQEEIRAQQAAILKVLQSQGKTHRLTPKELWEDYIKPIGSWIGAIFIIQYVARGGDLAPISRMLSKLL